MNDEKVKISKNMMMGELLKYYPECEPLIRKYFSGGCFGCPSLQLESLEMAAKMHDQDIDRIIADIKKITGQ